MIQGRGMNMARFKILQDKKRIVVTVENIVSAFLNPEYWALKTIMSGFKK